MKFPANLNPGVFNLSLFLIAIIWGINNPLIKHALRHFLPLSFNGLCFALATLFVFILLKKQGKNLPNLGKDWLKIVLIGILGNAAYQICFVLGINWTLAGNASLILAAVPAFVAIFSHLTKSEKVSWHMGFGIALSCLGVYSIMFSRGVRIGVHASTLPGDLLILTGAILTSLCVVGIHSFARKYDTVGTVTVTLGSGTVVLFLVSIPSLLKQIWSLVTFYDWLSLIYTALLATALAQVVVFNAIKKNGGVRMASYNNIVPLVSLLVAWGLLGETPKLTQIIGGAAILLGTFITGSEVSSEKVANGVTYNRIVQS